MSKANEICVICQEYSENLEVMCPGNHWYCTECINSDFETKLFNQNMLKVDKKCSICRENFYENKLHALLNPYVKNALLKLDIFESFSIPNDLFLMNCPLCPEKEIRGVFLINKNDFFQFYNCNKCMKRSCLYCWEETKTDANHKNCSKYLKVSYDLDKVVENAINFSCSKCKRREIMPKFQAPQVKSGCCHIRCFNCNGCSCYICGGYQDDVDRDLTVSNQEKIYAHNVNWKSKANRCPMYLSKIKEVIPIWPEEEEEATKYFLEYKLKSYMKKVIEKWGKETVLNAYQQFKTKRFKSIPEEIVKFDYSLFWPFQKLDEKIFKLNNI
jgi:hypothetical protein